MLYGKSGNGSGSDGMMIIDDASVEMLITAALSQDIPGLPLALAAARRYGRYSWLKTFTTKCLDIARNQALF